jgi:hypothetical protein
MRGEERDRLLVRVTPPTDELRARDPQEADS